jgi:hypothetical protein
MKKITIKRMDANANSMPRLTIEKWLKFFVWGMPIGLIVIGSLLAPLFNFVPVISYPVSALIYGILVSLGFVIMYKTIYRAFFQIAKVIGLLVAVNGALIISNSGNFISTGFPINVSAMVLLLVGLVMIFDKP